MGETLSLIVTIVSLLTTLVILAYTKIGRAHV